LKSGAAYTCIDPSSPDEHIRDILKDSDAVALLTDADGVDRSTRVGFESRRVLNVAELLAQSANLKLTPTQPNWLTPRSLAYIIYTSGTTGLPKGVMIEHRSIVNLVASDIEEFTLQPEDRVAQSSSPAYDSSVEEIWLALAAGASIVVMDEETTKLGPDLVAWLRREHITVLCPPPTLLRTAGCDHPDRALPDLSLVYVGGEALPKDVADRWSKGRRLVNGYGPTECTVTATRATIREGSPITIGWPVPGVQAYVMDQSLREVEDGRQGELCLGGVALARGYWNRPDLTEERFPRHNGLGRIYRTGDLVSRLPDGSLVYHGRIDSQVKLRGYRIELEAIESRLVDCAGVRQAACNIQTDGAQKTLVAFIVPDDGRNPSFDDLKDSLRAALPEHMIPGRFAILPELPTTIGGKLDRKALPVIENAGRADDRETVAPQNVIEQKLEAAFREVLRFANGVSVHDDFFKGLGGDSLSAAELISLLRDDPVSASVTVRDLYEARTIARLAERVRSDRFAETERVASLAAPRPTAILAGGIQFAVLLIGLLAGSLLVYLSVFEIIPSLLRTIGFISFLLLAPLFLMCALLVYTPFAILLAVVVKKTLIGRYRAMCAPVWGGFYVRNWIAGLVVRSVPWKLLEGTVIQTAVLRLLGARIGRRVHLHRGVNLLQGGWDLLEIGDDATISQDASIELVSLEQGQLIIGPVSIGERCTLEVRASVGPNTRLEAGAYLTALSYLPGGGYIPAGERWDGNPAQPAGLSPAPPLVSNRAQILPPIAHGMALILARLGLGLCCAWLLELPAIIFALWFRVDSSAALEWLANPSVSWKLAAAAFVIVTLQAPLILAIQAAVMRAIGRVRPGVISRWSLSYVRICLKVRLVESAGLWLSGTLFWPIWLRLAGMKIGHGCEISTIIDVVPELFEVGRESFFADGIYLGGPRIHQGTVTLGATRLGENAFVGNHAVIPTGQNLPDNILIGISTVADDKIIRSGTSWFGQPPFELPRREVVDVDRSLTHEPSPIRYWNRVIWEAMRFALPIIPLFALTVWYVMLSRIGAGVSRLGLALTVLPLMTFAIGMFFCLLVLSLKWLLLGRVRPGRHALWSCWCSRWDFLYVAWRVYASRILSAFEGTPLIPWFLRAMGARVGRGVVLGGGFAQVVDPDMLCFEDGAVVSGQFQAHTFEDRVLKIDRVRIRERATIGLGAVLLYGADVGAGARVAPHSVVMKHESLLADHYYSGSPTRDVQQTVQSAVPRNHVI
jgi:non-ribosomal peptide synthetase-like protein